MIIVYTENGKHIINENLLNEIKKNDPILLEASDDTDGLVYVIAKSIDDKYGKGDFKSRVQAVKKYLNSDENKDLLKNGSLSTKEMHQIRDDVAKDLGLINDEENIEQSVEKNIINQAAKDTNGNMSGDVAKEVEPQIMADVKPLENTQNTKTEYNMQQNKNEQKETESNNTIETPNKKENVRANIAEKNMNIEELKEYSDILEKLGEMSKSIINRCSHVIKVSTGIWGGQGKKPIKDNLKLALGGFNFKKIGFNDNAMKKYYIGALESADSNIAELMKNTVFYPLEKQSLSNDDKKIIESVKDSMSQTCYLLSINNNQINDIYRAIRLDDVLNGKFYISMMSRQKVLNAEEEVITFRPKVYPNGIACIIVVRPLLNVVSKLFPDIKRAYNAAKMPKVV